MKGTIAVTLEELTALEDEWEARHPYGTVNNLHVACERMGIYEAWRQIFAEYVALARSDNPEALKRAHFLAWYEQAEPSELSGLYLLDRKVKEEALQMVEDLAGRKQLNDELRWMLPYYYSIADWYLIPGLDAVENASKENVDLWQQACLEGSFAERGQLGRYWTSIRNNLKLR